MAYRLIISPDALVDLVKLHTVIALDSPDAASRMVERILNAIDMLELFPLRQVLPDQSPKGKYPVRILPVYPYIVYFRVREHEGVVRVLNIIHGARRRRRRFKK